MDKIKDFTNLKDVLDNPLSFINTDDKEEICRLIPDLYKKIAKMLFEKYDIRIYDSKGEKHLYSFAEVEFYYHKEGILDRDVDNCVYPRTCDAEKFLWHDTGVDICFKSDTDIDDFYFGGILIRSLIDNKNGCIIGGPGRCANELAFSIKAGDTPQLCLKEEEIKVELCSTIRQGIDCDVDKNGKAKVEYCYFISQKNWSRKKTALKKNSDFSGYVREMVYNNYNENPQSNRIEKLMKSRMKKKK